MSSGGVAPPDGDSHGAAPESGAPGTVAPEASGHRSVPLLPSVWLLPQHVWASRHDIVRGIVILYAIVVPAYGFLLDGARSTALLIGIALLVCALLGSIQHRRFASVATSCGLLLPSLLSDGVEASGLGLELTWFLGLMLAWLYRDWLVFPAALLIALMALPFGEGGEVALVRGVSVLAIGVISVASWVGFEAAALRNSIAGPEGARNLAKEFEVASRSLGVEDRQAKRAFALAVLRSLRRD